MYTAAIRQALLLVVLFTFIAEAVAILGVVVVADRAAARKAAPIWQLQLVELSSGITFYKQFETALVLGRAEAEEEAPDRLYISQRPFVSRRQCALITWQGRVWVRNLSRVNVTLHNQQPLYADVQLSPGDVLQVGDCHYYVEVLCFG